jgi:hypothetical protein
MLLKLIIILGILYLLYLLLRPYRDPYVRRTTKSYNGRPYGKERELY